MCLYNFHVATSIDDFHIASSIDLVGFDLRIECIGRGKKYSLCI